MASFDPQASKPTNYTPKEWFHYHITKILGDEADPYATVEDVRMSSMHHEAARQSQSADGKKFAKANGLTVEQLKQLLIEEAVGNYNFD